jgi:predicted RNase H-like nuclease (RuvC/YqgF family)
MQFLVICGMSERIKTLAFQVWRDHITNMIQTADYIWMEDNSGVLRRIQQKIAHFDDELPKLKEATSMLELVLWKMKMKMNGNNLEENLTRHQKKIKTNQSELRQQSRVTCGADIVIGHVLPFLITV